MGTHTASHDGQLVIGCMGEKNRKWSGRRRRILGETRWSEEEMDGWVVCRWSSTVICMDS